MKKSRARAAEEGEDLEVRLERMLEEEGHLVRSKCDECEQNVLGCAQYEGSFLRGNFCTDCRYEILWIEERLREQGKDLQRHLRERRGCHLFFLVPDELWRIMRGRMTKLRYFDPTDRTEESILHNIRTQLTFA